jgi:phosphoenolpyruvate carboxylase
VRLEITSIWQTEDHPREGLTVVDEREHVLFYLVDILYRVVPLFYEEIEAALAQAYGVPREQIEVPSILHFGSWVGATWTAIRTCTARPFARPCIGISR